MSGDWHGAADAERYEVVCGGYDTALFGAAGIGPRDRVLDVGCGYGRTTLRAAHGAHEGRAVGNDLAPPLLAWARRWAEESGVRNVAFVAGDAQTHPFPEAGFDVVISRFGTLFFADPVAAFANLARALRPGGRLALTVLGDPAANDLPRVLATAMRDYFPPGMDRAGAPGPSSLSDPEHVRSILTRTAFHDIAISPVTTTVDLGATPEEAADFCTNWGAARDALTGASPEDLARLRTLLSTTLKPYATPGRVHLRGTAWLVTATRT